MLRAATVAGDVLVLTLDWQDSISHPDDVVEWELWSSSDQVCGDSCTRTQGFISDIMSSAVDLEEQGAASFSPHYITWSCPVALNDTEKCGGLCINGEDTARPIQQTDPMSTQTLPTGFERTGTTDPTLSPRT